jgi:FkbH-like protein
LDVIVLFWRFEDVIAADIAAWSAGDAAAAARAESQIDDVARAVAALRARFGGTIVVTIPPFPDPPTLDLLDPLVPLELFSRLRQRWLASTRSIASIQYLDLDALQRYYGSSRARDARTAHLYRQPYREAFLALIGERLAALIGATRVAARKCIALDCDGTLWGGIVGEDGPGGVEIGDDFPGSAYRDFQTILLGWKRRGVLLTLLSRNDEADVWAVFDERPEMRLRREDVAAWRINWGRKADNLPQLAAQLGIGIDSFVFVDDNPAEVAEMRAVWPEVRSLLVPDDAAELVDAILSHRLFDAAHTTDEDRQRTAMAAAESRRVDAMARMSREEFLTLLQLTVRVERATERELPRIAQLVAKTNQFNLTTTRRSADELRRLMSSSDHHLLALWAADRFGDHGLTGVAILRSDVPTQAVDIDTLLLSCRVLGRGVEAAFLAAIALEAARLGVTRLTARFVRTAKNGAAEGFLEQHGFVLAGEGSGHWVAALSAVKASPPHVALTLS